jgi:hypothetical protein
VEITEDRRFITKPEPIDLRNLDNFNEAKLRDLIVEDPTILGLGDLAYISKEKTQLGAGRLDLLLSDLEGNEHYEVELQLGKTDESHIIRCLEYWDIEKKRNPQYEHIAVLVAEDITSRFLNVISLFNGFVPIIALKLAAFRVNDQIILNFVKVLDKVRLEQEPPTIGGTLESRNYWVNRTSESIVSLVDAENNSCRMILEEIAPSLKLNFEYTRNNVIAQDGSDTNIMSFVPRKKYVLVYVTLSQPDQASTWENRLAEKGISVNSHIKDNNWLSFRLTKETLEQKHSLLNDLFIDLYRSLGIIKQEDCQKEAGEETPKT